MATLVELLRSLAGARYWGEVTIFFKDGEITVIEKHERIKLDQEPGMVNAVRRTDPHRMTRKGCADEPGERTVG